MRARRERHVETVIDEDPCPSAAHGVDAQSRHREQIPIVEPVFANLYQVNSSARSRPDDATRSATVRRAASWPSVIMQITGRIGCLLLDGG